MILQTFTVLSRAKTYAIVDRDLIDSETTKRTVDKLHARALGTAQEGAKCKSRGLPDRREFDNKILAVFDAGDLLGIFMLGSVSYVSGPWKDLQSWTVSDALAPVLLDAVPLPGVFGMAPDVEEDFAADIFAVLVNAPRVLESGQGRTVGFDKLHYGIFKNTTDPNSLRVQGQHAKVQLHKRLIVTEAPHPSIPGLTIAQVRAP